MSTKRKLTKEQREQLKRWATEGNGDYTYVKQRIIELGWPMVPTRQQVHFYKKFYGSKETCPTCGQIMPQPSSKPQPAPAHVG
jgi:DNA repair exonuclease SbcCD ATPase subunit